MIWASQAIRPSGTRSYSVTVVDLITRDAARRRLVLLGWYQLLDTDSHGRMLWAIRDDNQGDRALIVQIEALERALRDYGDEIGGVRDQ